MLTDWALIRRAARELTDGLAGARVRDVGLLPDGRPALRLRTRTDETTLALDPFGTPPLVTIEATELGIAPEVGFIRALAVALRERRLLAVRAPEGERLLEVTFGARSRFGVVEESRLAIELVPRFGNIVLERDGRIVAAAHEFSLAENGMRAVEIGRSYTPPPPRPGSLLPAAYAKAGVDPAAFLAQTENLEPLYVHRREGRLLGAFLLPLPSAENVVVGREASVLALFGELRAQREQDAGTDRGRLRRTKLDRRLSARESRVRAELDELERARRRCEARDGLRSEGEAIYAELYQAPPADRDELKARAQERFAAYRKLGATLPHIERRSAELRLAQAGLEELRWELDRVADADLADVEAAIADLEPHGARRSPPRPQRTRRRAPLQFCAPDGSQIVVGRSPSENADITFRLARPNDWWLHVKGVPGAHVVLRRDDGRDPSPRDLEAAAALAAYHSKARESAKAVVEYTRRKHVRKRPNAAPGLVWYTHASGLTVAPRADVVSEKP